MKAKYLKSAVLAAASFALIAGTSQATTVSVYDASDTVSIDGWFDSLFGGLGATGNLVFEDFTDETPGWYSSYDISFLGFTVGTFASTGAAGTGTSSSQANGQAPGLFQISSEPYTNAVGRGDLDGNSNYLDSADNSEITFTFAGDVDFLSNLYFYFEDPNDAGATLTTIYADGSSSSDWFDFTGKLSNAGLYFVGIDSWAENVVGFKITVNTTGDGWGIDDMGIGYVGRNPFNAPVPEPATMLLIGTGIAGLAGVRRRNKK